MRGEVDRRGDTDAALQIAACARRRFLRFLEPRQKLDRPIMELIDPAWVVLDQAA